MQFSEYVPLCKRESLLLDDNLSCKISVYSYFTYVLIQVRNLFMKWQICIC
jgi:hypothetical protein